MNRVIIINGAAGDDAVIKNGRMFHFPIDELLPDPSIWAVQWYGDSGEVEYSDKAPASIDNLDDFAEILAEFDRLADAEDNPPPLSLIELKQLKKSNLETERDRQLNDPDATVLVNGSVFQAGPSSMADLNDALTTFTALGSVPEGFEWRDQDNINHSADLSLLASIAAARAEQKNIIWQQSWVLKDAVDAIDDETGTQAELNAIVWPAT